MKDGICSDIEVEACIREGPFCPLYNSPELVCPRLRGLATRTNENE